MKSLHHFLLKPDILFCSKLIPFVYFTVLEIANQVGTTHTIINNWGIQKYTKVRLLSIYITKTVVIELNSYLLYVTTCDVM